VLHQAIFNAQPLGHKGLEHSPSIDWCNWKAVKMHHFIFFFLDWNNNTEKKLNYELER
jgi:hypothetical protein